jgi:hypothetical protein
MSREKTKICGWMFFLGRMHYSMSKKQAPTLSYRLSAIVGCMLLGLAAVGLLWFFFGPHSGSGTSLRWSQPTSTPSPEAQFPVFLAHGITLTHPSSNATLSQIQALYLASQLTQDSSRAKSVISRYALLNSTLSQAKFLNTPAWIICYQQIPLSSGGSHDLYVVLDANSGTELFSLWS